MVLRCLLAIFILLLSACGTGVGQYTVPAEFLPYVHKFESDSALYGNPKQVHNLVIQYGDTDKADARCLTNGEDTPYIVVDKTKWDKRSDTVRQLLIYHELGHCILDRKHKEGNYEFEDDGLSIPLSLMNPILISELVYEDNSDYYLTELFTQTGKPVEKPSVSLLDKLWLHD